MSVDALYAQAKANLDRGVKTVSAEYAKQMIEADRAAKTTHTLVQIPEPSQSA